MSYSWKAPSACMWIRPDRRRQVMWRMLTLEFFIQPATTSNAQGTDELLEIYGAILILVKNIENKVGEFSRITKRKELLVYPAKFDFVKLTRGAICKKPLIPTGTMRQFRASNLDRE
jgi:hypothetical protein